MPVIEQDVFISIPHGNPDTIASTQRYRYQCEHRKGGLHVLIQHTLSGCGTVRWKGREWPVPAGHAFVCLVPERFAYYYPKGAGVPWKFVWVDVFGVLARQISRSLRNDHGPVLPLPVGSALANELRTFATMARKRIAADPHDLTLAATTFLLNWKRQLDQPQNRSTDPVAAVMKVCRARFREPLGIKELSAMVQMSREHLTRVFTKRAGVSPARYLRDLRLAAARDILSSPRATQKEAAARSGFSSVQALQRALRSTDDDCEIAPK